MDRSESTDENLASLLKTSAQRFPDAVAVRSGDVAATYAQLDHMADRFADTLTDLGVLPGDRVVLWAEKSIRVIAVMQAALRIGAVYVPVAPSNPATRVERIIRGCTATLIITDGPNLATVFDDVKCLTLDVLEVLDRIAPPARPTAAVRQPDRDAAAYILYTSGSTGDPKGVCISHRNALAFIEWAVRETGLTNTDRLANHAPLNFDLSVFDIYGAFRTGASVDLIGSELAYSADGLSEFIVERSVTVWYSVPSAMLLMTRYGSLLESGENSLRVCIFAGETYPIQDLLQLRKAWPGTRIFNWYGPTETNVCTSYEVTERDIGRDDPVPIGTACPGTSTRLDPEPEGEIVVDGPTVMVGYWGREPHRGAYRTGDLGRRRDGFIEYIGRADGMVKLRGYRVELGEIENALVSHPAVVDAAVSVLGAGMDTRLHAVLVPAAGHAVPSLLALKSHLAERVPGYMLVDSTSTVDALPRTQNGKLDRRELTRLIVAVGE